MEVVDLERRLFEAELKEEHKAEIIGEDYARVDTIDVRLYQAVPKGKHMDLVVEKATELGVGSITPLVTEHGVVKLGDERKKGRALASGGRGGGPAISAVAGARRFGNLSLCVMPCVGRSRTVLCSIMGKVYLSLEDLGGYAERLSVGLFVGPEGGWSEGELSLAVEFGVSLAQLGAYRLRSETAGIVAVARARAIMERACEQIEYRSRIW